MYAFLRGIPASKTSEFLVLDVGGVGYRLFMSALSLAEVEIDTELTVYTRMIVKEGDLSLCGFTTPDERTLFDYLITVSGIGKKSALGALSMATYEQIISWIMNEDFSALTKIPGVGKKTAERLVVELRDKFKKQYSHISFGEDKEGVSQVAAQVHSDIVMALSGLGFARTEINSMCAGMPDGIGVEAAIKYALSKRRRA